MNISSQKIIIVTLLAFIHFSSHAETVTIEASRDTTLIEDPDGALANGSGPRLFVGRTSQAMGAIRRGLVYFDVAEALPRKAIIENVSLSLHLSRGNPGTTAIGIYRVMDEWGEGISSSNGGGGAPAEPGDSTWMHTFAYEEFWIRPGGNYVRAASAITQVGGVDFYDWHSTPHLTADVITWLRAPKLNHGWILIGDEAVPSSVQAFDSRESPIPEFRPRLTIEYRQPGRH